MQNQNQNQNQQETIFMMDDDIAFGMKEEEIVGQRSYARKTSPVSSTTSSIASTASFPCIAPGLAPGLEPGLQHNNSILRVEEEPAGPTAIRSLAPSATLEMHYPVPHDSYPFDRTVLIRKEEPTSMTRSASLVTNNIRPPPTSTTTNTTTNTNTKTPYATTRALSDRTLGLADSEKVTSSDISALGRMQARRVLFEQETSSSASALSPSNKKRKESFLASPSSAFYSSSSEAKTRSASFVEVERQSAATTEKSINSERQKIAERERDNKDNKESGISQMYTQIMNGIQGKKDQPRYSYYDVEDAIGERVHVDQANRLSNNALDILALYIKGQKLLYTEAKTYCEQQLNFLMLPAIFISCASSIFSFMSGRFGEGSLIMASLNGFNAFLLAVISYLKLDAKAQAHKTSAYKFDKLESMCEFSSGKFLFFDNDPDRILMVVSDIEKEVKEIKETNQFILPESIRYEFTNTYSTNVFLMVKKLQHTESTETQNLAFTIRMLKDLYEELTHTSNPLERDVIVDRINAKEKNRDEHIYNILRCREKYFRMDEAFNHEIERHIARANRWFLTRMLCCDWLKS